MSFLCEQNNKQVVVLLDYIFDIKIHTAEKKEPENILPFMLAPENT